jgi:hypothetical protein
MRGAGCPTPALPLRSQIPPPDFRWSFTAQRREEKMAKL